MLILIVILLLLFGGGFGTYRTWNNEAYGPYYGGGISLGTILVIVLICYALGLFGNGPVFHMR